jgi:hypothetical protein
MDDLLLVLHVAAGAAGLIQGPLALLGVASWSSLAYLWAVGAVSLTALGLVALDPADLWWLAPLALLASGLALLGRHAEVTRARAHGWGGSYIALVTATLVVSVEGQAQMVAWVLPTLAGLIVIERWVSQASERRSAA